MVVSAQRFGKCFLIVALCMTLDTLILKSMVEDEAFPRSLIRRATNTELSLGSLEAIAEMRQRLDELEMKAVRSAREKGATVEDIAEALDLTPQAIYHRLRSGDHPAKRGRPKGNAR
jgi:hypothetical protein